MYGERWRNIMTRGLERGRRGERSWPCTTPVVWADTISGGWRGAWLHWYVQSRGTRIFNGLWYSWIVLCRIHWHWCTFLHPAGAITGRFHRNYTMAAPKPAAEYLNWNYMMSRGIGLERIQLDISVRHFSSKYCEPWSTTPCWIFLYSLFIIHAAKMCCIAFVFYGKTFVYQNCG